MRNDTFEFNVLKFFDLILVVAKFFSNFLLDGSFLHQVVLKLILMVLLGVLLVLLLVVIFFVGVWGSLLLVSQLSLIFRWFWLLRFMEICMPLKKLKRWVLLVYGLNVILPWFVLHLLLGLMFLGFFVIGGTLALITMGKSSLGFLIFFMK